MTTRLRRSERSGEPPCGSRIGRKLGVRAHRAGSFGSQVVLAECFDCRSRRATRGAKRPRAKSSRKRRCLALLIRATGEGALEAGFGRQSSRSVAGSRPRPFVKADGRVSTRRGKALRIGKAVSFERGRGGSGSGGRSEVSASACRDRERQRLDRPPRSRLKTPERRGAVRGALRSRSPARNGRRPHPRQMTKGAWST